MMLPIYMYLDVSNLLPRQVISSWLVHVKFNYPRWLGMYTPTEFNKSELIMAARVCAELSQYAYATLYYRGPFWCYRRELPALS